MNALLCALLLGAPFGTPGADARARPPLVRDLVEHAPVFDTRSSEIKSLEAEVVFSIEDRAEAVYYVSYVAPDQYMLVISDRRDGLPLLIVSEGKLLLYDPVRGAVVYREPMAMDFDINRTQGELFWGARLKDGTGKSSRICLDFHSLLLPTTLLERGDDAVHTAKLVGPDRYRVVRAASGGLKMNIDFDSKDPSVVRACEVKSATQRSPLCRMTRLSVNRPPIHPPFRFPSKRELKAVVPVIDLTGAKLNRKDQVGVSAAFAACIARTVALDPQSRKFFTDPKILKLDLKTVGANDRKLAPLLRRLTTPGY